MHLVETLAMRTRQMLMVFEFMSLLLRATASNAATGNGVLPVVYLSPPLQPSTPSAPQYKYGFPPPPVHESPPPPQYENVLPPPEMNPPYKAVVAGSVYCDLCKDGKIKKPLQGVTVGVFCWNGHSEDAFYGSTDQQGRFEIALAGFDYVKNGGRACRAKLISAAYTTTCTTATNLHGGLSSATLHIKSKSLQEVVLLAGPFAYISYQNHSNLCYVSSTPPYKSVSPPPTASPSA